MGMGYGASLTEAEFRERLDEALFGEMVFSDRTPWADLTDALGAIAAAPRPVPARLVEAAWGVYRRHDAQDEPSALPR